MDDKGSRDSNMRLIFYAPPFRFKNETTIISSIWITLLQCHHISVKVINQKMIQFVLTLILLHCISVCYSSLKERKVS